MKTAGSLLLLLAIFFTAAGKSPLKCDWLVQHLLGKPLRFGMPLDSLQNLYEIKYGEPLIINGVNRNIDSLSHRSFGFCDTLLYKKSPVHTYYFDLGKENDTLAVVLQFCYDRLFKISFFTNCLYYEKQFELYAYRLNDFILVHKRYADGSSENHYNPDKKVSWLNWYSETRRIQYQILITSRPGISFATITDKQIVNRIPVIYYEKPMIRRSWKKVKRYIDRHYS